MNTSYTVEQITVSAHTPGPWEVRSGKSAHVAIYQTGTSHDVAIGVRPADASFIVQACNAHDALLGACRAALAVLENPDADGFDANLVEQHLRAVLAKAGAL